ncbi:MAG: tetratricopeptide repeat protein [Sinobacteraceae bacterium]|nr:tetratricopeptide repeat protein [Nevskiaceae bacterium]
MVSYNVRDVERVLQLSRSTIRGLIEVGFVKPERGPRREYRFSFRDLIVLRAARALIHAKLPRKRIRRSLEELRRHLPETMPMSGLSICAVGDRVVVRDGGTHWQADDGQYLLGLDVVLENGMLHMIERTATTPVSQEVPQPSEARSADEWFDEALELEMSDPAAARAAYEQAIGLDPQYLAAWINWGRLLHEQGATREADKVYARALQECGPDSLLLFNRGVLLEDVGKATLALEAYHAAIEADPNLADCHYNLARLYEVMGKPQHAIRHLGQYRRLMSSSGH